MNPHSVYALIKAAFIEGWHSHETPCCAFNDPESAWEDSEAKAAADEMIAKHGSKT